jgi:GNAT superfamily N-acetyltransferase
MASLCGAPDDAEVELKGVDYFTSGSGSDGVRMIWHNNEAGAERTVFRDKNGDIVMHNNSFNVNEGSQGKGIGAKVFDQQIQHARRLGVKRIETDAVRSDQSGWIGYKVWPMFGYDGNIPENVTEKTPNGETRISELMASKEGRDWWSTNGKTIELQFDMSPGSYSMKTWEAYKARKQVK